jgi:hypothetical protein
MEYKELEDVVNETLKDDDGLQRPKGTTKNM